MCQIGIRCVQTVLNPQIEERIILLRLTLITVTILLTDTNHTSVPPSPLSPCLLRPLRERETPVAGDKRTTKDVDDLDEKDEEAVPRLFDLQENGLDIVLDKDARDHSLVDLGALLGDGVLVRKQRVVVVRACRPDAVDSRHDGNEVLKLVEVARGHVDGPVEGVLKRWEEAAERELVDDMREVEGCARKRQSEQGLISTV